jgi:integrase
MICKISLCLFRAQSSLNTSDSKVSMEASMSPVQELLGHRDVSATMIYTHVWNRGGKGRG